MRRLLKTLPAAMIVALLLLAAACGGGGDKPSDDQASSQDGAHTSDDSGGSEDSGASSGALISNASDALGESADNFQSEVESLLADFIFDINSSVFSVGATGEFRYQSPDQMYMLIEMGGAEGSEMDLGDLGNMEFLALGDTVYVYSGFTGWMKMSLDEMGEDADQLVEMMEGHSPFDYARLVEELGGEIQDLGTDQIDGETYAHFRITMDLKEIVAAFGEALGATGGAVSTDTLPLDSFSGPIAMDIWVEPTTLLPRKLAAVGTFQVGTESAELVMEFNFREYNGAVDIPGPPADAKTFEELFSAFSADESGE
jgi:hypothetical protein